MIHARSAATALVLALFAVSASAQNGKGAASDKAERRDQGNRQRVFQTHGAPPVFVSLCAAKPQALRRTDAQNMRPSAAHFAPRRQSTRRAQDPDRSEAHLGRDLLHLGGLEVLGLFHAGHIAEGSAEEGAGVRVDGAYGIVVSLALDGDAVLCAFELDL